ncbi:MAG: TonB-dependent receptor domain-containing protein [Chitinophagaceae bacterium]
MRFFVITCIALFGIFPSQNIFGQNTGTINGLVTDEQKQPLANVTVSLLLAKDSSLVKSEISGSKGNFEFSPAKGGNYIISFQLVGFEKQYSAGFLFSSGEKLTIPTVSLKAATQQLKDVTVVSTKKPMIEVKADKTIFNVENSINATGSNALELLQKSPGIMVDNNDNISMKGKTGVKIYIDGKMTQLDVKSLAAYLKGINSNDVEAIEMISNPSAKYDAAGNAGVINIRLKKNKKFGTNGSVNAGFVQGVTPKGNTAVNLNYRNKKVNLFGNLSANKGRYENGMNLNRTQNDTLFKQSSVNHDNDQNLNIKAGADFFLNSKQTIGFIATGNFGNNEWSSYGETPIYYAPTNEFVKKLVASNNIPGSRTNSNFNFNYRYADTSGTEVNFDADYGLFRGRGNSIQPNNYFNNNNQLLYRITNRNFTPTDIDIYTAKLDVDKRLGKGKLGYGAKFSYVKTSNTFDFFTDNANGIPVKVLERSNQFGYTENVNAAYINYQRSFNTHWSLQVGLRAEQTNSKGILTRADGNKQSDDTVKRSYLDFFPSLAITYNINQKHTLNLTYSRRIDRPTYQDLNPFEFKLDELTYQKGNAFLRPQYTHNVELTHTFLGMLNTTVGYSHVKDYATQVTDTTNLNATFVQQQNLATQQILSFSIGSPLPIKPWWNGYVNLWYNYLMFDGQIGQNKVKQNVPTYGAYMQQSFTLGKGYTAELSGWFNGPGIWAATWRSKAQGAVDLGLQKQLMQNKATVKLSVTDLFFTAPWRAENDFGGLKLNGRGYWESRTVRLNFTYRFGSNQIKSARQRQTGLESESKRIK